MERRCEVCGSFGVECVYEKPVEDCGCARCANARAERERSRADGAERGILALGAVIDGLRAEVEKLRGEIRENTLCECFDEYGAQTSVPCWRCRILGERGTNKPVIDLPGVGTAPDPSRSQDEGELAANICACNGAAQVAPTSGDKKIGECAGCGRLMEVEWQVDPYASEIEGDHTEMWLCRDCAYESGQDI